MAKKEEKGGKIGRKPRLTYALIDNLVKHLEDGISKREACDIEGISVSAFLEWVARGEGRDPDRPKTPLYAEFAVSIRKAVAKGCQKRTKKIQDHGDKDWKALAYLNRVNMPEIYIEQGIIDRGVEEKLQEIIDNLFWMMPPESYQDMMNALKLSTEYNLELGKMEELKAIQVLIRREYFPKDTSASIGKAYIDFRRIVRDNIFPDNNVQANGNGKKAVRTK